MTIKVSWGTATIQREIHKYETRYELKPAELEAAVEHGTLRETAEVADWVVAYRTLKALADERQARSE